MMSFPILAPSKLRKAVNKPALLIAESDDLTLDAMRRYFHLSGYEIETATGGVECLEKLRRFPDGVLILSLELSWGGGDGVLAVMRDDPVLTGMTVILTTIGVEAESWSRTTSPPILHMLVKPYCLETLLSMIRSATD